MLRLQVILVKYCKFSVFLPDLSSEKDHLENVWWCTNKGLFTCSQRAKTFGKMSTFWKNGSKRRLVKLGCKD